MDVHRDAFMPDKANVYAHTNVKRGLGSLIPAGLLVKAT